MMRIRQYRRHGQAVAGKWSIDVNVRLVTGGKFREQLLYRDSSSKAQACAWGEEREHYVKTLARQGLDAQSIRRVLKGEKEVEQETTPTLAEFKEKFIEHAKANRQKASTVYAKESILRRHLVPALGAKRLNRITEVDIQALKVTLAEHSPKTCNNVLTVLSKLLRVAKRLGVIDAMPVETMELLKVAPPAVAFYTFEEYGALVVAAERLDPRILAAVLLGGDAGLRAGETMALEQADVSRANRLVHVDRQVWRGVVDTPKGGKGRTVPMTEKLAAALAAVRHLRGDRLLVQDDGSELRAKVLRAWMKSAQRRAGLKATGNYHVLRHTFCSHLAMRGAPAKVIQELAGHVHLSTTMRYMHLSPGHKEQAIRLLDARPERPAEVESC